MLLHLLVCKNGPSSCVAEPNKTIPARPILRVRVLENPGVWTKPRESNGPAHPKSPQSRPDAYLRAVCYKIPQLRLPSALPASNKRTRSLSLSRRRSEAKTLETGDYDGAGGQGEEGQDRHRRRRGERADRRCPRPLHREAPGDPGRAREGELPLSEFSIYFVASSVLGWMHNWISKWVYWSG